MENQKAMGKLERAGGIGKVGTLMGRQVKELHRSILRNGIGQKGERGKREGRVLESLKRGREKIGKVQVRRREVGKTEKKWSGKSRGGGHTGRGDSDREGWAGRNWGQINWEGDANDE